MISPWMWGQFSTSEKVGIVGRHYRKAGIRAFSKDAERMGRAAYATQAGRARGAYSRLSNLSAGFGPGGAARSGLAWGGYAAPFAMMGGAAGAGLGGFIGLTQAGPGGMTAGAAIGGGVGVVAGTAGFAFARPIAKHLGHGGLSMAGMLGGGVEMMFGIGSKAAKGTATMMGDAAVGAGGRMGARAAGGIIGGAIGGLVGGTGGAAMLGTAMGALTGPRLRNMSGGVMGLAMRHPMAAMIGAGVAAAGLRSGGRVLRHMLAGDRPSRVGEGSWGEVYGMSSNHNNTAGLGLALHYNR